MLAFAIGASGCGSEVSPPSVLPKTARRPVQTGLFIRCSHIVVDPDLIRGVLIAQNIGPEPIALIDRWNSWGATQWTFSVGTRSAANPQLSWYANFYTETILAPGEVRHARFQITRSRKPSGLRDDGWWFLAGDHSSSIALDPSGSEFLTGQRVTLSMNGGRADLSDGDGVATVPIWTGAATCRSEELTSIQELDARVSGLPLR